ncbi:ComEC/Rec2 family competence protein [Pyxidicoccus sp. 3LG]
MYFSIRSAIAALLCMTLTTVASAAEPEPLALKTLQNPGKNRVAVTVFDVGQGNCALISCPNGKKVMMDCGTRSSSKSGDRVPNAKRLFDAIVGDTGVEALFLSHSHVDHYSLVDDFLKTSVPTIVMGGRKADYSREGFPAWLRTQPAATTLFTEGMPSDYQDHPGAPFPSVPCGERATDGIYVLGINTVASNNPNAHSIVAMLRHTASGKDPFSMMFLGDAPTQVEQLVLERYEPHAAFLDTDVVLAAHHGARRVIRPPNTDTWLEATTPDAVIYSAGRNKRYGHPNCGTVDQYLAYTSPISGDPHSLSCSQGRRAGSPMWRDATDFGSAQFNTQNSGAVVTVYDGDANRMTVYTCPGNQLASCTGTTVTTSRKRPASSLESDDETGSPKKARRSSPTAGEDGRPAPLASRGEARSSRE